MSFWPRSDALANYRTEIDFDQLCALRSAKKPALESSYWRDVAAELEQLAKSKCDEGNSLVPPASASPETAEKIANGEVSIGNWDSLLPHEHEALDRLIRRLVPWRKGPFNLCGHLIDTEWRSDLKWNRVLPHLVNCSKKRVLDVGASTGYYMYRMSELNPEVVVGLEPSERCYFSFELLQLFFRDPRLVFEMLRSDDLGIFRGFFDVALCMGVIYHVREPLTLLRHVRDALKPGGLAIVESQVIDEAGPYALFPQSRYMKSHNMYFIPTPECLVAWMERTGFADCELVSVERVTSQEQRRTEFAPYESLDDFLDPLDSDRTVEGYPAPSRAIVKGFRKS